jgi:hypothetical protein
MGLDLLWLMDALPSGFGMEIPIIDKSRKFVSFSAIITVLASIVASSHLQE